MPDMDMPPRLDAALLDALRGPDDQLVRRHVLHLLADLNEQRLDSLRPVEHALVALLAQSAKPATEQPAPGRTASPPGEAQVPSPPVGPQPQLPLPPAAPRAQVPSLPAGLQEHDTEPEPVAAPPERKPKAATAPPVVARSPGERVADELAALWQELAGEPGTGPFVKRFRAPDPEPSDADARAWDTWLRIHLLCLRLPASDAVRIRDRAVTAVRGHDAGYEPSGGFVPALPMVGRAADDLLGTVELLPDAEARLTDASRGDRRKVHELVLRFVWLAAHDPSVWVGGASLAVGHDELQRFEGRQAEILRTEIGQRLNDLLLAEPDSEAEMKALANVDELLRGVVPLPLPAKGSWWLERLGETYDMLSKHPRHKEYDLSVRPPHLRYVKLVEEGKADDTSLAVPDVPVGEVGKVLWTLRFPRTVQPTTSGRVLYGAGAPS